MGTPGTKNEIIVKNKVRWAIAADEEALMRFRASSFDGDLNIPSRGLVEFIDASKLDAAFLYGLVCASQERRIKPHYRDRRNVGGPHAARAAQAREPDPDIALCPLDRHALNKSR
jgi:hypothetical protein